MVGDFFTHKIPLVRFNRYAIMVKHKQADWL